MGRPSEGPAPPGDGDGIIILPPGDGEVPPPVHMDPERGQIVVQIEARLLDSLAEDRNVYNKGESLRAIAVYFLDWPTPVRTVLSYQWIDPNNVPFPPRVVRGVLLRPQDQPPAFTDTAPFTIPLSGPAGNWSVEISCFLEIGGAIAYPIAFPAMLSFDVL